MSSNKEGEKEGEVEVKTTKICNLAIQDLIDPVNRDLLLKKVNQYYYCCTCGNAIGWHWHVKAKIIKPHND